RALVQTGVGRRALSYARSRSSPGNTPIRSRRSGRTRSSDLILSKSKPASGSHRGAAWHFCRLEISIGCPWCRLPPLPEERCNGRPASARLGKPMQPSGHIVTTALTACLACTGELQPAIHSGYLSIEPLRLARAVAPEAKE